MSTKTNIIPWDAYGFVGGEIKRPPENIVPRAFGRLEVEELGKKLREAEATQTLNTEIVGKVLIRLNETLGGGSGLGVFEVLKADLYPLLLKLCSSVDDNSPTSKTVRLLSLRGAARILQVPRGRAYVLGKSHLVKSTLEIVVSLLENENCYSSSTTQGSNSSPNCTDYFATTTATVCAAVLEAVSRSVEGCAALVSEGAYVRVLKMIITTTNREEQMLHQQQNDMAMSDNPIFAKLFVCLKNCVQRDGMAAKLAEELPIEHFLISSFSSTNDHFSISTEMLFLIGAFAVHPMYKKLFVEKTDTIPCCVKSLVSVAEQQSTLSQEKSLAIWTILSNLSITVEGKHQIRDINNDGSLPKIFEAAFQDYERHCSTTSSSSDATVQETTDCRKDLLRLAQAVLLQVIQTFRNVCDDPQAKRMLRQCDDCLVRTSSGNVSAPLKSTLLRAMAKLRAPDCDRR